MNGTSNRPARVVAALFASALIVAACGSATKSEGASASSEPAASRVFVLPVVDVLDVATGAKVAFGQLSPSKKPLLLWFWAPH